MYDITRTYNVYVISRTHAYVITRTDAAYVFTRTSAGNKHHATDYTAPDRNEKINKIVYFFALLNYVCKCNNNLKYSNHP